MATLTL